jgi:hypothetical protein
MGLFSSPHAVTYQGFIMSNALTVSTTFSLIRTTKSGKEVRRDMVGLLLSGTPAERTKAAEHLIATDWANGDMVATSDNLIRVFTQKAIDNVVKQFNFSAKMRSIESKDAPPTELVFTANKDSLLKVIQGLIIFNDGAKGEKAKLINILANVATAEATAQAEKLARKAEFDKLNAPSGAQ